jgi:hypothetical protein
MISLIVIARAEICARTLVTIAKSLMKSELINLYRRARRVVGA